MERDPKTGRRIDPATGKLYRRTAADVAALRQGILDTIAVEPVLTLRRLHYALVSLGVQPNTLSDYRELSRRVTQMRRDGEIPRGTIVDNGRETVVPHLWGSLADMLEAAVNQYRRDPWQGVDDRVAVMVEKDALRGVLWPTCDGLGVPLTIMRGRAGDAFLDQMAQAIDDQMADFDGDLHVAYLGDWDPSGWAIPQDIEKRLRTYVADPSRLTFTRIGLDPAQITALGLPRSMSAKTTDPNYRSWPGGTVAVEVDAVPVAVLQQWVEDFVMQFIDQTDYAASEAIQQKEVAAQ